VALLIVPTGRVKGRGSHPLDGAIANALAHLARCIAARNGSGSTDSPEPRLYYSPMERLLLREDDYLLREGLPSSAVRALRKAHLACYRMFLSQLRHDVRQSRRIDRWEFQPTASRFLLSESALLYLAWLGWKSSLGFTVDIDLLSCLLDGLLLPQISHPVTV
jgi:hypothetical protein